MFKPVTISNSIKDKIAYNGGVRTPRTKIHQLVSNKIIQDIIEHKKDNLIRITAHLNKSINKVINTYEYPDLIYQELVTLGEYLITHKKLRLFYISEYQIIVIFDKNIRTIKVYYLDMLVHEGTDEI